MKTVVALLAAVPTLAMASIEGKAFSYADGDTKLEGYVARDPRWKGNRPVVLIVHDWDGLGAYEEERARQVAELGYIGFAVDYYGAGVRPTTPEASRAESSKYSGTPELGLGRLKAALGALSSIEGADASRVVAMGYCFGGGQVLNAARAGLPLKGVASFHGALASPLTVQPSAKLPKIIAFHAIDDPVSPRATYDAFLTEMSNAKADYQMVTFNLAVHAFTVKGGPQYDATADRRSWSILQSFLKETLD